jgi:hypothetical protein
VDDRPPIRSVKRELSAEWLGREGVVGVGIEEDDAGREFIAVMVEKDKPGLLDRIAAEARGHLVQLLVTGKIRAR